MKKTLLLFTLLLCLNTSQTKAQTWVTIPDANFVSYLQTIIPAAMHGDSLNTSSTLVTTTIHSINVAGKSISNLNGVQYFSSLTYLNCYSNSLTNLPALPSSLDTLFCGINYLLNLSSLPNSLTYLECEYNGMNALPTLPSTLVSLYCSVNPLINLPSVLPNSLQTLSCEDNQLTNLPVLPNSLQALWCGNNSLTSLPTLPNSLQTLITGTNNIACFPTFPNSITYLQIDVNSYNCLPNYIPAMGSDTVTYPLCTAGNTNGCPSVNTTDIKQITSSANLLNIYPNPTNNIIHVEAKETEEIKLIDVLGNEILTTKEKEINVSNLSEGIYFVRVNNNTQKIIVQH